MDTTQISAGAITLPRLGKGSDSHCRACHQAYEGLAEGAASALALQPQKEFAIRSLKTAVKSKWSHFSRFSILVSHIFEGRTSFFPETLGSQPLTRSSKAVQYGEGQS